MQPSLPWLPLQNKYIIYNLDESVALKVIQVEKISSKVEKRFLKNEINCLKELKYSNCIIQLK